MSGQRRVIAVVVVGAILLAASAVTRGPVASLVCNRLFVPRPEHPATPQEEEFLNTWARNTPHAPGEMVATPFQLKTNVANPVTENICIENTSPRTVHDFWFFRRDMPNFYSAETILESVAGDKRTETEKALALWQLFSRYYYNYYPLNACGLLIQPSTVLAVTGSAQCNYAAVTLETLCQMAGMKTRLVGVELPEAASPIAHCTMEVFADGRWVFMDPDGGRVYWRADGQPASIEDLRADPRPVLLAGHGYYNAADWARAIEQGSVRYYEHEEPDELGAKFRHDSPEEVNHHHMRFDLLPGAKVTLYPREKGSFFDFELPVYAGGSMTWSLRAEHLTGRVPEGLAAVNLTAVQTDSGLVLRRRNAGRPASLLVAMRSPYLITAGRLFSDLSAVEPVRGYVLTRWEGLGPDRDGWQPLGDLRATPVADFNALLARHAGFSYALKIDVPGTGITIRTLRVSTFLQCAPRALPYLQQGSNALVFYAPERVAALPATAAAPLVPGVRFDNGIALTFRLAAPAAPAAVAAALAR